LTVWDDFLYDNKSPYLKKNNVFRFLTTNLSQHIFGKKGPKWPKTKKNSLNSGKITKNHKKSQKIEKIRSFPKKNFFWQKSQNFGKNREKSIFGKKLKKLLKITKNHKKITKNHNRSTKYVT